MNETARWWICAALASLLGCGGDDERSQGEFDEDAGALEAGAPVADAAAMAPADASIPTCVGQDPFSQLICGLIPPNGAQGDLGALQDIIEAFGGLGGLLGGTQPGATQPGARTRDAGRSGGIGGLTMPTDAECEQPADQRTELLCRLRRDGGLRPRTPRDAGAPPEQPAMDAGAESADDAGDASDDGDAGDDGDEEDAGDGGVEPSTDADLAPDA